MPDRLSPKCCCVEEPECESWLSSAPNFPEDMPILDGELAGNQARWILSEGDQLETPILGTNSAFTFAVGVRSGRAIIRVGDREVEVNVAAGTVTVNEIESVFLNETGVTVVIHVTPAWTGYYVVYGENAQLTGPAPRGSVQVFDEDNTSTERRLRIEAITTTQIRNVRFDPLDVIYGGDTVLGFCPNQILHPTCTEFFFRSNESVEVEPDARQPASFVLIDGDSESGREYLIAHPEPFFPSSFRSVDVVWGFGGGPDTCRLRQDSFLPLAHYNEIFAGGAILTSDVTELEIQALSTLSFDPPSGAVPYPKLKNHLQLLTTIGNTDATFTMGQTGKTPAMLAAAEGPGELDDFPDGIEIEWTFE